jgi:hypothetical protein
MASFKHLAAIRARLLADPTLVGLLGSGNRVRLAHIMNVEEQPPYPMITMEQMDGNLAVWAPRLIDGKVLLNIFVQTNPEDALDIFEQVVTLLHNQKVACSIGEACFHDIRLVWFSTTATYDQDSNAWRLPMQFWVRVSIHQT